MSKDQNIADIVKQLDNLNIEGTNCILDYIKQAKVRRSRDSTQSASERKQEHIDKDDNVLAIGNRVVLLTPGVDNHLYKEGTIKTLPEKIRGFLSLYPECFDNQQIRYPIKKLGKSICKLHK